MESQITSDRLIIRPRTFDDIETCMAMDRDPMVTKFIDGPWDRPGQHRAFLEERMATLYPHPLGYWSIASKEKPDEFLGWVMLLPVAQSTVKVELGWRLIRKIWGKGIATEATKCVMEYALDANPDLEFIASVHPENLGSIKIAEKIGMSFEYETLVENVMERFYVLKADRA